jgi:hypothetical protein
VSEEDPDDPFKDQSRLSKLSGAVSHRTASKYGYSEFDGVEVPVEEIEDNIAHYNLYDIPK